VKSRLVVIVSLLALVSCSTHSAVTVAPPPTVVEAPIAPPTPALVDDRLPPPATAVAHVPVPWPFDVTNYAIDLAVDPKAHAIAGSVTIDVVDAADGLTELPLNAVDFQIDCVSAIELGEHTLDFAYDGKTLRIPLYEPSRIGTKRRFKVTYSGHPTRGIYFNDGDPPQVYSQGECDDSRYWFPCHDAPDDRASSSVCITRPKHWAAVGNGEKLTSIASSRLAHDVTVIFKLDVPHVAYLNSFVAGDYEVNRDHGVVPLEYVVEKRDAPYAAACFRKTDDILKFFGDYTGLPYPYPKYSQTCVRNFMFGGMENISATTLTDHAIHPPDWEPARNSTSLVAHEAAHQWFGDWITCSDWSHCWLNEGFATYFDALFTEHDEGRDAFLWTLRGLRQGGLGAMDGKRRAVVSNVWADPFDLFDGHAYPGAAARLHMLRHLLGDEQFQGAIRHYVKKCGLTCVTTDDFQKAVEEFTGQDLAWFFDQWFRKPGYPVLKVRWKWDDTKKAEIVTVEQTQKAEGGVPEAYRLALDIGFVEMVATHSNDYTSIQVKDTHHRLEVTKRSESFDIHCDAEPRSVAVDPETALLARFDLDRSALELGGLMHSDSNPSIRMDAAESLGAIVRDEKRPAADRDVAMEALLLNAPAETFAPLRAAFMGQVASRKDDRTCATLIDEMDVNRDLRVRIAASDALHGFENNAKARDALVPHLQDTNDLMRASAVAGVAKLKHPLAFESLMEQVERPGWQSVARIAALRGFADMGDERAFATLVRFAAPGDNWSRTTAIDSLGRMGKGKPAYRDAVLPYLDDAERGVRQTAAAAIGAIADPDTLPTLVAHFHTETWPAVKDALRNAIKACRAAGVVEGRLLSVEAVRASEIRDRHAALRDEIDAFEPSLKTLAGDAKTEAETKLKSLKDQMAQAKRDLDELGVPEKPAPKPAAK
jgi:aminopeptidase N